MMNKRWILKQGKGGREGETIESEKKKQKMEKIKEMNSNTYTEYYCREVEILYQWGISVMYTQLGCKAMGSVWKLPIQKIGYYGFRLQICFDQLQHRHSNATCYNC